MQSAVRACYLRPLSPASFLISLTNCQVMSRRAASCAQTCACARDAPPVFEQPAGRLGLQEPLGLVDDLDGPAALGVDLQAMRPGVAVGPAGPAVVHAQALVHSSSGPIIACHFPRRSV